MRSIIIACLMVLGEDARAMFMHYETEKVPIDRLFSNMWQRLARNTNDFESTYQLARLHAMAYSGALELNATKKDSKIIFAFPGIDAGVPMQRLLLPPTPKQQRLTRNHLTNAIILYERSMQLLRRATNASERRWLVLPLQLGYSWCLDQAGRTNDALRSYRKTLKIAWQTEVEGEFKFKQWIEDSWEQIKAGRIPKARRRSLGPGVCFTEETIGYMLKLLDPIKDAKEIAELNELKSELTKMGRMITPILIPLVNHVDFSELINADARVAFDLDGSGRPHKWGWVTPKAAWLVFDKDGAGDISSGLQMFGNVTFWIFWQNGYAALGALDNDGDGFLNGDELNGLALWHDVNCDGKSDAGEVRSVAQHGIESLSCHWELHPAGFPWQPAGATFNNGKVRPTYDWIVPNGDAEPEKYE